VQILKCGSKVGTEAMICAIDCAYVTPTPETCQDVRAGGVLEMW